MKVKKILSALLTIALSVCLQELHGQSKSVNDTLFICLCKGTLNNGRPVAEYLLSKDIRSIEECLTQKNQDSIICRLNSRLILFEEPYLTLRQNRQLYQFSTAQQEDAFTMDYYKKLLPLSKKMIDFRTTKLSNGKHLTLSIAKISGEFWILSSNKVTWSEGFPDRGCNKKDYIYNLKMLDKVFRLTGAEKRIMQSKLETTN